MHGPPEGALCQDQSRSGETTPVRRSLLALVLATLATGSLASSASATGPGGWNHLGNGGSAAVPSLNAKVSALNTDKPGIVYVGGSFTNAGGIAAADRIATWNGTSWGALGNTPLGNGSVSAIAYHGGKVYAGGNFVNAAGNANADYLAVYDGISWQPFCNSTGPAFNLQVLALQVVGSKLYVGGSFQNGAGLATADYLIECDLATGTASSTVSTDGDFTGTVYALTADSNGTLYAGGTFTNLDGILAADNVASFDGSTWHSLGSVWVGGIVRALKARGTDVYVSSDGLNIGGPTADHVVRWNGLNWAAMGSNTAGNNGWFPASTYIYSMATYGSLVLATGSFQNANGDPTADVVAAFDGTTWRPIGSSGLGDGPWVGEGSVAVIFQGQLYAGGNFTSAGGDSLARFAASRSLRLPDALIAPFSGGYVGNNVYSGTAAGESKTMAIVRGTSQFFVIAIQNDGMVSANFTLKGTGAATGHTLKFVDYFHGQADITTAVKNGTFSTGALAPGASFVMRVVVKLSATAASTGAFVLTASSTAGTPRDAVKGIVQAT
jgi:hypothetical protein